MPNQRAKNKVLLGAFVDRNLKLQFVEYARTQELTASDALIAAIHQYMMYSYHVSVPPTSIEPVNEPHPPSTPTSQPTNTLDPDDVWLL